MASINANYGGTEVNNSLMTDHTTENVDLFSEPGVVVRQLNQNLEVLQAVGLPLEFANQYKVSPLPPSAQQMQRGEWKPTHNEVKALPSAMQVVEESSKITRFVLGCCGCLNLRPLTLNFYQGGQRPVMQIKRPFHLGCGCLGECCALVMDMEENGTHTGRIINDCSGCNCCAMVCCCVAYDRVENANGEHEYTVRTPMCCYGSSHPALCGNCCGGTCCKPELMIDIMDRDRKEVLGSITKHYAPGRGDSCTDGALFRCCMMFNNYEVRFPVNASRAARKLLLGSVFQVDYAIGEKKGNQN